MTLKPNNENTNCLVACDSETVNRGGCACHNRIIYKTMRLLFYKTDENRWYVDLPEWKGSKADLEMVAGADVMLEYLSEGKRNVWLYVSEYCIEFSHNIKLIKEADDLGGGAYYLMPTFKGSAIDLKIWLCDVTKYVFGYFPENIYLWQD